MKKIARDECIELSKKYYQQIQQNRLQSLLEKR